MYTFKLSRKEKRGVFYFLIVVGVGLAFLYGYKCVSTKVCQVQLVEKAVRPTVSITLPNGVIKAEVADTSASREQGLSGRKGLGKDKGMFFIFPLPGRYGFWMKDMVFPIDIIWINENGVVVNMVENAKPEDYPTTYINRAAASYVLEIEANKAREYGVYLGSKVIITR